MGTDKSFWVLENKSMPLYFGICDKRAHWAVRIDDAVKFADQCSAYMMISIMNELGYGTNHNVVEHMFASNSEVIK